MPSLKGKFETKARILAMKPQVCWRPILLLKSQFLEFIYFKRAFAIAKHPIVAALFPKAGVCKYSSTEGYPT